MKQPDMQHVPRLTAQQFAVVAFARLLKQLLYVLDLVNKAVLAGTVTPGKLLAYLQEATACWTKLLLRKRAKLTQDGVILYFVLKGQLPPYGEFLQFVVYVQALEKAVLETARMQALRGWTQWAREAVLGGAPAAHKYTKIKAVQNGIEGVLSKGVVSAQPFQLADDAVREWALIWRHHGDTLKPEEVVRRAAETLPPVLVQDLRAAIGKFKVNTGMGADHFDPRTLMLMPDVALQSLIQLFYAVERLGKWPF